VANALDKLKEYGVVIYYRNKKLFVGFPYYDANVDTVNFLLDYDQDKKVLPNAKAEGLEFRRAEDYKLKIRAVSILRDNSKLEVTVGDDGGDTITHHYSNIGSLSELTQMANEALKRMKVDGMTGNFKTIGGFPFCDHGWTCSIRSVRYPERNGKYFIEQVTTSYDSNGYKRDITPGRRAS
jgi:hypothetical protein